MKIFPDKKYFSAKSSTSTKVTKENLKNKRETPSRFHNCSKLLRENGREFQIWKKVNLHSPSPSLINRIKKKVAARRLTAINHQDFWWLWKRMK